MADPSSESQLAAGNGRQTRAEPEQQHPDDEHQQAHQYGQSHEMYAASQEQYYIDNSQQQLQQHQQQHHHHYPDDDNSIVYASTTNHRQYPAGSDDDDEDMGRDLQLHRHDEDDEDDDDDDMDDDPDESSELELPEAEEDIDYDVVYALHTFLATVEGQASVVKGDQLTLLDDSNSYWWLVRVLKTQLVGYIPAENIETPEERLARFYKKQNLNQARARDSDIAHGAASARRARAHFAQPHHSTNKMLQEAMRRPKVQLNPQLPGGGRFVDFGPPTFQEFEGYPYSDEESDGSMAEGEEGEAGGDFEDEEEEEGSDGSFEGGSLEDDEHPHARAHGQLQHHYADHQAGFAEGPDQPHHQQHTAHSDQLDQLADNERTQQYYSQETPLGGTDRHHNPAHESPESYNHAQGLNADGPALQPPNRATQAKAQAALGVANGGRPAYSAYGQAAADDFTPAAGGVRMGSADEHLQAEPDTLQAVESRSAAGSKELYSGGSIISRERTPPIIANNATSRLKAFTEQAGSSSPTASQESETKKISLTPRIAREDSTDSNLSELNGPGFSSSSRLQAPHHKQSQRNASNASSANADISNVSSTSGSGAVGRTTPTSTTEAEDRLHFRRGSAGSAASSVNSAFSSASAQKRGASPANDSSSAPGSSAKKKKSGSILGGLFSRNKKDKKEDKDKKSGHRKNSDSTSDDERGSLTTSPAPASPDQEKGRSSPAGGLVTQQLQQRRAQQQAKEDMFGAEAARRQQQVEAQNVMYQAYGIHPRAPGDATNSSTFAATVTPPMHPALAGSPAAKGDELSRQALPSQNFMAISPSQSSLQSNLSAGYGTNGRQLRPGSLIGSPHMANPGGSGEVPVLNVLRVFAGDNIVADATFKTVLLNDTTSTEELVKQALQRFRLDPPASTDGATSAMEAIMQEYYLTAKEVDGEETQFLPGQKPLKLFESLSQATGFLRPGQGFPSVKRSSVGSISSISSTLSMNPAIEKLRMSDFSDDSNVKLYINKRSPRSAPIGKRSSDSSSTGTITGQRISDDLRLDANRLSGMSFVDKVQSGQSTPPLARFAVKIIIHPSDLPDSMAFDPFSNALIAKTALQDREHQASRSPSMSSLSAPSDHREKVLFFPRNANVSELLETALDRFGIVEGVVDGGDDVDSKILKRRSMTRVRYCLASMQPGSYQQETLLNPSSKVLEAYAHPPAFKPYEKSSKEFRRRSMEAPHNAPSTADLQPTDPTFVIRRADRAYASSFSPSLRTREDSSSSLPSTERSLSRTSESNSVYATPLTEIPPSLERAMSPQQAKQEIIAAQRAASRANQRAMLSAHKNEKEGVDVVLADRSLIRSSRDGTTMRYSYFAADGGEEVDISDIVESEWRSESRQSGVATSATQMALGNSPSTMSHSRSGSYTSALASPLTPSAHLPGHYNAHTFSSNGDLDAEERMAIDRVASAPLSYDQPKDYLEQVLTIRHGETSTPPSVSSNGDSVDQKLERVLSKVRKGAAAAGPAGIASTLRNQQQQSSYPSEQAGAAGDHATVPADSGRSTPVNPVRAGSSTPDRGPSYVSQMMRARAGSATSHFSSGRISPHAQILERMSSVSARSTPQPEAPPSSGSSTPRRGPSKGHIKQPSLTSIASDVSSFRSGSVSTPATVSAGNTTSTPVSSTRNDSSISHRLAIPYRDDFGVDFLMQLVELEGEPWRPMRAETPTALDVLTGNRNFPEVAPALASVYDQSWKRLDDLESRLDQLLLQATHVA